MRPTVHYNTNNNNNNNNNNTTTTTTINAIGALMWINFDSRLWKARI